MKELSTVLKLIAVIAAIAGVIYAVVTYADELHEILSALAAKIREACAKSPVHIRSEYDDYADWDSSDIVE